MMTLKGMFSGVMNAEENNTIPAANATGIEGRGFTEGRRLYRRYHNNHPMRYYN